MQIGTVRAQKSSGTPRNMKNIAHVMTMNCRVIWVGIINK